MAYSRLVEKIYESQSIVHINNIVPFVKQRKYKIQLINPRTGKNKIKICFTKTDHHQQVFDFSLV